MSRSIAGFLALVVVAGCTGSDSGSMTPTSESSQVTASSGSSGGSAAATASWDPAQMAEIAVRVKRGLDAALDAGGRYDRLVKSVVVTVNGQPVYERYSADSGSEVTHNVYSVTKSVMSVLIGIAVSEGLIAGVDQTLAQLLPDHVSVMAPGVGAVTLEQVLTMTGGILGDASADPMRIDATNWVEDFLSTPLAQPAGEGFAYSSRGSHLLAAVLVQATGRSVLDYAREKLFDPLGIPTEPADQSGVYEVDLSEYDLAPGFGWSTDPQGLNLGMSDLRITAPDMAKIGQLYLDGGRWHGDQLVPEDWVATSTTDQLGEADQSSGYGYQWWVHESGRHPAFAAMGHAGQLIDVIPDLGLVAVVSCLDDPARFESDSFASIVERVVIPAIEG